MWLAACRSVVRSGRCTRHHLLVNNGSSAACPLPPLLAAGGLYLAPSRPLLLHCTNCSPLPAMTPPCSRPIPLYGCSCCCPSGCSCGRSSGSSQEQLPLQLLPQLLLVHASWGRVMMSCGLNTALDSSATSAGSTELDSIFDYHFCPEDDLLDFSCAVSNV